jgi:hypothetical protein
MRASDSEKQIGLGIEVELRRSNSLSANSPLRTSALYNRLDGLGVSVNRSAIWHIPICSAAEAWVSRMRTRQKPHFWVKMALDLFYFPRTRPRNTLLPKYLSSRKGSRE